MQPTIANIDLAKTILAAAAGNVSKTLDDTVGTLQDKLALAMRAEAELSEAAQAIQHNLQAARMAAAERAAKIRAEIRENALIEIVAALRDGTLSLAEIAALAGVALTIEQGAAVAADTALPVAAPIAQQGADAAEPKKTPADGQKVSQAVRENLRLQSGYMHAVKFADPNTGAGWSGRGPTPKWLKDLCVDGKTIEDFRVGLSAAESTKPVASAAVETQAALPSDASSVTHEAAIVVASEPETPEPVASAIEAAVESATFETNPTVGGDADIGGDGTISFDGSGLDSGFGDEQGGAADDDIGEVVAAVALMDLSAGNTTSFRAAA